jgi:crotonobetainyl-CoA:carnitine CoA-transferase CaiB-like acyl-CoA transferase
VSVSTADDGPLAGLRVLDVSTILAGPLVAQVLGDFGAEVIKIEHPGRGDGMRGHGLAKGDQPLWWKMVARNKRTVGLYLGDPAGAEIFRKLAATADVVIENFRPGTLERWGLGYDVLSAGNPGLILLRVTGFGQSGPYASRPAFGTLVESMSGFAHLTGEPDGPPTLPAFGLADSIAGMAGAAAVSMALFQREKDGRGQEIDLDLLSPIMTAVGPGVIYADQLGVDQQRTGNRSANNAPRNTYRTADGHWVAVSTSADRIARPGADPGRPPGGDRRTVVRHRPPAGAARRPARRLRGGVDRGADPRRGAAHVRGGGRGGGPGLQAE